MKTVGVVSVEQMQAALEMTAQVYLTNATKLKGVLAGDECRKAWAFQNIAADIHQVEMLTGRLHQIMAASEIQFEGEGGVIIRKMPADARRNLAKLERGGR